MFSILYFTPSVYITPGILLHFLTYKSRAETLTVKYIDDTIHFVLSIT